MHEKKPGNVSNLNIDYNISVRGWIERCSPDVRSSPLCGNLNTDYAFFYYPSEHDNYQELIYTTCANGFISGTLPVRMGLLMVQFYNNPFAQVV
jgi:hypothetical protein